MSKQTDLVPAERLHVRVLALRDGKRQQLNIMENCQRFKWKWRKEIKINCYLPPITPPPQITTRAFLGSVFDSYLLRSWANATEEVGAPVQWMHRFHTNELILVPCAKIVCKLSRWNDLNRDDVNAFVLCFGCKRKHFNMLTQWANE